MAGLKMIIALLALAHGHATPTCGNREGKCAKKTAPTIHGTCDAPPFDSSSFTPKKDPVTDAQCGTNWIYSPGSSGVTISGATTATLSNADQELCCAKQAMCGSANEDGSGSSSAHMTCPVGKVYDPLFATSYCVGAKCTTTSPADVASCCTDDTYNPKTYVPTTHVETLHGFFHYGGKDVFDPFDTDYQMAIAGFGALAAGVGLFLLLTMWTVNLCMCFKCFRKRCTGCVSCGENKKKAQIKIILLLFLAGVIAAGAYSPRGHFKTALVNTEGILDDMRSMFMTIQANAEDIAGQFDGGNGYNALAAATKCCTPKSATDVGCDDVMTSSLTDLFTSLEEKVESMSSIVDGIPEKIGDANDFLKDVVTEYTDMALGGVVAMMWLLIIFAIIAILTTCKSDDHIVLFFGSITLLVLIVTVAGMVLTTVTIADFCHPGPSASLAPLFDEVLTPGSQTHAMATYYTTCEGTDPLGEMKNLVTEKVQTLVDYLDGSTTIDVGTAPTYSLSYMDKSCYPGSCMGSTADPNDNCDSNAAKSSAGTGDCNRCDNANPGSAVVKLSTKLKDEMLVNVQNIGDAVSCEVINKIYTDVVQDTICAPFLAGLAELWVVLAAAGFIILCVFIAFPCVTRIEEAGPEKALYGTNDGRTGVMIGDGGGVTHELEPGQVRQATPAELSGADPTYSSYSFQK